MEKPFKTTRRRRPTISLRTLLLLVLVFGGWLGREDDVPPRVATAVIPQKVGTLGPWPKVY